MDPDKVWQAALGELALQMTKATFDTWVRSTSLLRLDESGTYIVGVPNAFARDWLQERLKGAVERTMASILKKPAQVAFEIVPQSNGHRRRPERITEAHIEQPELSVEGVRVLTYNEIVEPDIVFVGTQYFRRKWLPLLGPVTWLAILELRQRCYWNKKTGEVRDTCKLTFGELAAAVGVSESTLRRALAPADEEKAKLIEMFILGRQVLREYSPALGREINKATIWRVRLDEPLLPEDERRVNSSNGQNDS